MENAKKDMKEEKAECGDGSQGDQAVQNEETSVNDATPETAPEEEGVVELLDRLRRLGADYQNYKKRVQKEIAQTREFANESLLRDIIPVLDDMELAMESARSECDEDNAFMKGMELVHGKLVDALEKKGVSLIAADGLEFDPGKHSAMMQEESDSVSPGTVLRVLQKGYAYNSRTLRPAMVIVSKAVTDDSKDETVE